MSLATAAGSPRLAGLPLADALSRLQQAGLEIVYSSALVRPEMIVAEEPTTDDLRQALIEILLPHRLTAVDGPGGRLVVVRASETAPPTTGGIEGVAEMTGGVDLPEKVVVRVVGQDLEAAVGPSGAFAISSVAPGVHALEIVSSRTLPQRIEGVLVTAGKVAHLRIRLSPRELFSREIVVTPSHFRILEKEPEQRQFLSRAEVDRLPHVADDLYRAIQLLPGAASGDYSATLNLRGGVSDEMLVLLDGLELFEPFHLKDFQNVFSTIDAEAVGGVDVLTGGFPVEYGDRLSGVMDISFEQPTADVSTTLAVGTLHSRFVSQGLFDDGAGLWAASGRAWYPAAVVELAESSRDEILTDYYDLLARVQHSVGRRSTLSVNTLAAYDDLGFTTSDEDQLETVTARYSSFQLWANLKTRWSERVFSQTVVSAGRLERRRQGSNIDLAAESYEVDDRRDFEVLGLRQDWTWELGTRHALKWGVDVKGQDATYDYTSRVLPLDGGARHIAIDLELSGTSIGAYVADRVGIGARTVIELGLRWDRQGWLDEDQLSPRLNLSSRLGPGTTLRLAWGRFAQSQRLNELQVEDGVTELAPAQYAEHRLVGLEHRFSPAVTARFELHSKLYSDLRPRFENLFNPIELFPEAGNDRVRLAPDQARVHGLELVLRATPRPWISWWLSYAHTRAEDRIDGAWQPRSWDQPHAATLGLGLQLPRAWSLSLVGSFHTGWPTTPVSGRFAPGPGGKPELVVGPRNSARYPDYLRFDVRATRSFSTRHGDLLLVLEAINLTDRKNVCCIDDFQLTVDDTGEIVVIPERSYWAPIVPSVSLRWTF